MNTLIENNKIYEKVCGANFAYIMQNESDFLLTEYKVLQSQGSDGLIKCMKMLYNGNIELYYLTAGYKTFTSMLPGCDAETFMSISSSLIKDILDVKTNGFLSVQNIDLSFDKVFVDVSTMKVYLVYLPVASKLYDDDMLAENELRSNLVKLVQGMPNIQSPKTMKFAVDLTDGTLTLESLYKGLKVIKHEPLKSSASVQRNNGKLKLIAVNAPGHFELAMTKKEFIVGKNASFADGVIPYNSAISRKHCMLIETDGSFTISDLGSANGTFVNKVRLIKNKPQSIDDGDIIRLANSDFKVVIE